MKSNPVIWLAYVSYPATTAAYFERALRNKYKVLTCGPQLTKEVIEHWDLKEMKSPIKKHDISTGYELDLRHALNQVHKDHHPDLFLWVESVFGYMPENIRNNGFPTACYLIDSHVSLNLHLEWAKRFDYIFIAQKEYIPDFIKAGIDNVFWLPLGCDPVIHSKYTSGKLYDVSFVGSLKGDLQARRNQLLGKINEFTPVNYKRCFLEDMARCFSESKIVFNNAIKNDLNMRLFEVMSTGTFLLTDIAANSGQEEMFRDNEDYCIYTDSNIVDKLKYYLKNEELRERIAQRGQTIVHNGHTYEIRLEELIKVCLRGQKRTPSPEEWRYISETDLRKIVSVPDKNTVINSLSNSDRSFVIPVLDMSPASPYNIEKLLVDLNSVYGDVIVIFNSQEMAEKYRNHKRINYYAIMKENVGVSRAWNIGLNISQTKITFILNADLSLSENVISSMENYLNILPDAAIVGPQGSFYSYERAADITYFHKGSFDKPFQVDAVSGFLFAVKTELFNSGVLKFDNQYTPCYFEEWDLGLQIKQANLKSYVVPVTEYEHEWSGSIRALRTIKYLNKEETSGQILERNRELFRKKWDLITSLDSNESIKVSLWREVMFKNARNLIIQNKYEEAESAYRDILSYYPADREVSMSLGILLKQRNRAQEASEYFRKAGKTKTNKVSTCESSFPDYYNNPRPDIQSLVDDSAKTILDIGCGSGIMGLELKKKNTAEIWGVELNESAALKARQHLDCVLQGPIERNIELLPEDYFDTIIFADVIEHLVNPAEVLESIKPKLHKNGQLILSIPNVRFWNVIVNLLEGNWEYEETGILDKTHLRFFTYSSILNLLRCAGYDIVSTIAVVSKDVTVPDKVIEALKSVGYNVGSLKEQSSHFQYLVKCVQV